MQVEPTPLVAGSPAEVPLPDAPLTRVIAQVRFPPILSIHKADSVADFQEALRSEYPHLHRNDVRNIEIVPGQEPNISEAVIWRLADRSKPANWRVSLGMDFVAVETSNYGSRNDFLARLGTVLACAETCFGPAEAQRLGLRYIDRLEGEAVERIGELVQPSVLGILQPEGGPPDALRDATAHMMTQAQFVAAEGTIQGRWGNLPPNATYDPDALEPIGEPSWVLDLDMFSLQALPFKSDELVGMTEAFAKRTYSVFRLMVTEEFLRFYGGRP
ncbi:MAG: TIGR04255 family protein [Gammaproteobacteria bacterium]|nr:TIGR04255 family protein [Gammaproteobacteria bacterium]